MMRNELRKLREAQRRLTAAFEALERLPAEQITPNSIDRILGHLAEADRSMDRLELLLDILEHSLSGKETVAA